jgi:uroporphyrinogen-III synthase
MTDATIVINTRPAESGEELQHLLHEQGINALHCPAITIESYSEPKLLSEDRVTFSVELTKHIAEPDTALIFVSRSAASAFSSWFKTLTQSRPELSHLISAQLFAVGKGTATQLAHDLSLALTQITYPSQHDSEGVLALPELSTAKHVAIIKGERGRELMAQSLKQRGQVCNEWAFYQRHARDLTGELPDWPNNALVLATSIEIIESIAASATGSESFLNRFQWLAFSRRIKQALIAQKVPEKQIYTCEQMNNSSIINTIKNMTLSVK